MKQITTDELKQLQTEGKKLLVDFYATWCGPCKQLMPKLEAIEGDYPNVQFVKMDVDQNMDIAKSLGIRGVPTVIIFEGNDVQDRSSGVQPDQHYRNVLSSL